MLKHEFAVATGAVAVFVAVLAAVPTPPAAAPSCKAGYAPVKIQGNYVCRIQTPKLPLKAKTQQKKSHNPFFRPRLVDKASPR